MVCAHLYRSCLCGFHNLSLVIIFNFFNLNIIVLGQLKVRYYDFCRWKWIDARHQGDQPENKRTSFFVFAILATLATVIINR